jgi:phosphopantothenoylcysteine synthetase/decarboxylase
VEVRLVPTEDVVASVASCKRPDQRVVVFAVEDLPDCEAQAKARQEMADKNADWVVLNPPQAMDSQTSRACILGSGGVVLDWGLREKDELAGRIARLLLDSKPSRS